MSNLPPGVRESDIPGMDDREVEMRMACEEEEMVLVPVVLYEWLKAAVDAATAIIDHVYNQGLGAPCRFVGKVDVIIAGGVATWSCPECLTDHEEEV